LLIDIVVGGHFFTYFKRDSNCFSQLVVQLESEKENSRYEWEIITNPWERGLLYKANAVFGNASCTLDLVFTDKNPVVFHEPMVFQESTFIIETSWMQSFRYNSVTGKASRSLTNFQTKFNGLNIVLARGTQRSA